MAIAINGTGTITGISVGGLNDSIITSSELVNGAVTAAKIDSLPAGSILQVVQTVKTNSTTVQPGATWTDIPTLSVSLTPASSSNKVLISFNLHAITNMRGFVRMVRGSTAIGIGDADGSRVQCTSGDMQWQESDTAELRNQSMTWLDSPSTTSSTTYKLQVRSDGGGDLIYINRSYLYTDAASRGLPVSVITVMEVAA
jgi:hypothetical protein